MVKSVEHLSSELELKPLGDLERLDETEVEVPVMWRNKDISAGAVLTWRGQAKSLRQIDAASKRVHWLEQDWAGKRLAGKVLQLGLNRRLHTGA